MSRAGRKATYPDFLGIGAQKAGTTWLGHNLRLHPQIWMPRNKELHYFDGVVNANNGPLRRLFGRRRVNRRWRYQVGRRIRAHSRRLDREGLAWDLRYYLLPPGDRWYASLFQPEEGQICGEITPAYSMLDPEAVARVHGLMPEAKIVFFVRNPIERAWSQAVMHFGKAEGRKVESVADEEVRRHFRRKGSRRRTGYSATLENWSRFYPEDRIFVGFLEDVSLFPGELLRRVYGFLGVDPSFAPPGARRKVHARAASTIPTRLATALAHLYYEELVQLEERLGGYAAFWRYCAGRLIEDPPEDENIAYPFWKSSLWREWTETSATAASFVATDARAWSNPLSRL